MCVCVCVCGGETGLSSWDKVCVCVCVGVRVPVHGVAVFRVQSD